MSIPAFDLYLFDIDGTLVDSAADICGAARDTLAEAGATGLTDEFLRRYIGYHLNDLFADVFPGITPERSAELLADYRRRVDRWKDLCTRRQHDRRSRGRRTLRELVQVPVPQTVAHRG